MDIKLRIFIILLILICLFSILKVIKLKKLDMRYGMYWSIIFIILLIMILFPSIIENIAKLCGFKEAPNMLFLIAIFILFYIVFRIYITISRLQEVNRKLVQEISLLKEEKKK